MAEAFTTHPLTPDRWGDLEAVLGASGVSGCWCMYWLTPSSAAFRAGAAGGAAAANRDAFRAIAAAGPPPGLLAYAGETPVAWARVMPRAAHQGLDRSPIWRTALPTDGVWSLSCFRVRAGWRGRGLTRVLIDAAIGLARTAGARALEAYPTDTTNRRSPDAVYLGLASTFRAAGFREVQRARPDRPMMRLDL